MLRHEDFACTSLRRAFGLLRACHRASITSLTEKELVQAVCECMVSEGGYRMAWLGLIREHPTDALSPVAWAGTGEGLPAGGGPEGEDLRGPVGRAIRERQPVLVPEDGHCPSGDPASLTLPLKEDGTVVGTLTLHARENDAFSPAETELLQEVAEEITFGIGHLRLMERQHRLAAVIEAAPDMIGFADPENPHRTTYLNPAGQELLGPYAGQGLEGIFPSHPQWAARRLREEALPTAMREGLWRGETAVLGPEGEEIPVDQVVIAHRDPHGEVSQLSTLARDIRDRKRAEEALQREATRAESMNRALLDALPGLFYLFDENGWLHQWNRELERVTGMAGQILAHYRATDFFPEVDHACIEATFQQALEGHETCAEADLLTAEGPVPHQFQAQCIVLDDRPFVLGIALDIRDRKAAEERHRLMARVFEAAHDAFLITDSHGRIIEANPAFTEQTGYRREEALGAEPGELLDSLEHAPGYFRAVFAEVAEHGFWEGTVRNRRKDGTTVMHHETIAEVRDEHGHCTHYVATMADVTPIKEAERRARREQEFTDAVIDSLPGVFFFLDRQGYNHLCNRHGAALTGGRGASEDHRPVPALSFFDQGIRPTVQEHIRRGFEQGEALELEATLVSRAGKRVPTLFNAIPVQLEGEVYLCGLGIDISQRAAMEAELRTLARTDPLTGACNRNAFEENLRNRLAESERYGSPFALALLDLDYFKQINDRHGHQVGDSILKALVETLRAQSRDVDTICRWGGEEFVVLMPQTLLANAVRWAERLQAMLSDNPRPGLPPIAISIGLTEYHPGDGPDSLLYRVDTALYDAKEAGRACIRTH
ncbi:PAS domain S-box protein [Thiohalorhabdus methylotrophus]|uniref:PAS domain S-box protein n=1 Tax=Thiohalorhabdus methylotrophus TaxID=3242694 RepID=A0ABV4TU29_9GAMM